MAMLSESSSRKCSHESSILSYRSDKQPLGNHLLRMHFVCSGYGMHPVAPLTGGSFIPLLHEPNLVVMLYTQGTHSGQF